MRLAALALLIALAPARAGSPAPPPAPPGPSPLRAELAVAVEDFHAADRRLHRGGPDPGSDEHHALEEEFRRTRRRMKWLKRQIRKGDRRADDYYQEDPYPGHAKDPASGGIYRP